MSLKRIFSTLNNNTLKALKPEIVFRAKQQDLTLEQLLKANLHIGEHKAAWHQNNLQYLYGHRNDIHIINLEHTLVALRRAAGVCFEVARQGGNVVFVGTKPKLHKLVVDNSIKNNCYYIIHWTGGLITNKERVLRRSVGFDPDKVSNIQDDGEFIHDQPFVHKPDLLVLLDYPNTKWAVHEANYADIPVIALCDTDCDPHKVQYPIPGNDDSYEGVELVCNTLGDACGRGYLEYVRANSLK